MGDDGFPWQSSVSCFCLSATCFSVTSYGWRSAEIEIVDKMRVASRVSRRPVPFADEPVTGYATLRFPFVIDITKHCDELDRLIGKASFVSNLRLYLRGNWHGCLNARTASQFGTDHELSAHQANSLSHADNAKARVGSAVLRFKADPIVRDMESQFVFISS